MPLLTSEIDISKARAVGGWMTESELLWLAQQAQTREVIVELGSYLGRSTRALADHSPGLVYAIDDWFGPRDKPSTLTRENRAFLFDMFKWNVRDLGEDKLRILRCDHKHIPIEIQPDMVFIDGGHEYGNVCYDIQYWMPRLKSGGLLCGHDYDPNFPDVIKAVSELVPNYRVASGTAIWYCIQ